MEVLISQLLPCSRFAQQSQLLFQGKRAPRLADKNPNTIDCGLKLYLGTGSNIMQIGNRFWESHLEFAGYPAYVPYFSKDHFLCQNARADVTLERRPDRGFRASLSLSLSLPMTC